MRVRLLLVTLLFSAHVWASYKPFANVDWTLKSSPYNTTMSLALDKAITLSFQKEAGHPLILKVASPYLINHTTTAVLYQALSPLQQGDKKQLLQRISLTPGESWQTGLVFSQKIGMLLAAMDAGNWGLIELQQEDGQMRTIDIPAVNFRQKLKAFYAVINTLPAMSWEQAASYPIYFALARDGLSQQEKINLARLVSVIRYDGGVKKITLDGYTDPSGNRLANLALSERRVQSVRDYLVELGVDESLFKALRHHGQRYPIPGAPSAKNRRVVIQLYRSL